MSLNRYMGVAMAVTLFGLTACSNSLEPTLIPIPDEPGEATLVDVSAGALADPSAFDVITGGSVRTDQFSGWDFLFQIQEDGSTVLWPRGAITGEDLDAGLQKVSQTFDALREAPENGYTNLDALPVALGDVFAVQSRRDPAFGRSQRGRHHHGQRRNWRRRHLRDQRSPGLRGGDGSARRYATAALEHHRVGVEVE